MNDTAARRDRASRRGRTSQTVRNVRRDRRDAGDSPYMQIMYAYSRIARIYRPAASWDDGADSAGRPDNAEFRRYVQEWMKTEQDGQYRIFLGFCDFELRPASIYSVEAARAMAGGRPDVARRLLRLALDALDEASPARGRREA